MANRSNYYPRTLRLQSWEVQMGGFSITLLKLDKEMEELLNAEEDTIAF
ncbi:hypothetical protein [Fusobacterium polymorphum]|nr:hypothetical protein [Fusobacterium polymorphum]UTI53532.1 hypothetical protein NLJ26_02645 [Fusobacterium polymorphum]WRL68062.1 hypothetical protein VKN78_09680 [Fusobacterium polymorphum]